jgi:hypothetical protein
VMIPLRAFTNSFRTAFKRDTSGEVKGIVKFIISIFRGLKVFLKTACICSEQTGR